MSDLLPFEEARELLLDAARKVQRGEITWDEWHETVHNVLWRSYRYVPDPQRVHRAKSRALARELNMSTSTSSRSLGAARTLEPWTSHGASPDAA